MNNTNKRGHAKKVGAALITRPLPFPQWELEGMGRVMSAGPYRTTVPAVPAYIAGRLIRLACAANNNNNNNNNTFI